MIYLSSDWHFFHNNVMKFDSMRGEKYLNAKTMSRAIVKEINTVVCNPEDGLIFLGDLGFGNPTEMAALASRIKCKKIWVLGNHDGKKLVAKCRKEFALVTTGLQFEYRGCKIHLSHYPAVVPDEKGFIENYQTSPDTIYIFGHTHKPKWTGNLYDISYNGGKLLYTLDEIVDNYLTLENNSSAVSNQNT